MVKVKDYGGLFVSENYFFAALFTFLGLANKILQGTLVDDR